MENLTHAASAFQMPVQTKINIRSTSAPGNFSQRAAMSLKANQMASKYIPSVPGNKGPIQLQTKSALNRIQNTTQQPMNFVENKSQFTDLMKSQPAQIDSFTSKQNPLNSTPNMPQQQTQFTNISTVHRDAAKNDASAQINAFQKQFQGQLEKLHMSKYMNQKGSAQKDQQKNNEPLNVFNIQNNSEGGPKQTFENFMDISLQSQPQQIMQDIHMAFTEIMNNPNLKGMKTSLAALAISLTLLTSPTSPAMAAELAPVATTPEVVQQSVIRGNISYSNFINAVKDDQIRAVEVSDNGREAAFRSEGGGLGKFQIVPDPDFFKIMKDANIDLSVLRNDPNAANYGQLLSSFGVPLVLVGLYFLFSRNSSMGMPGGVGQMGKSKARIQTEPDTGVNFDAVAGVDEAKQELAEIVDFLKNPERYSKLGAKIPRGALLIGPPGTGKTLLAKAVAGEAGVPFLSISAAEFIEMFVGVGASRVRDLFEQAKKNAPCIVFIDELDAVGRQRAQGIGMGNDEREQTINQLLTEMDGFEGNKGIIVLAATNIPEVLDKALLRPGRFDRQIAVALPDLKGRQKIIRVHARDKKLDSSVDLDEVAKRCLGMSGADLANIMNESAIFSARRRGESITEDDIYDALDRIQIGMEKKGATFSDERQKLVSYHEAGHALLGAIMQEYDLVNKITIVPRGGAGGVTIFTPNEEVMESGMYSKQYLLDRICVGMGGRIAEEIINGKNKVTTGASNDFQQVTNTARMMVEQMGMSEVVGPRAITSGAGGGGGGGAMARMNPMQGAPPDGQVLLNLVDEEVDRILNEQYQRGMQLMTENKQILDTIATTLVQKEKINGTELLNIIEAERPDLVPEGARKKVEEFASRGKTQQLEGEKKVEEPAAQ